MRFNGAGIAGGALDDGEHMHGEGGGNEDRCQAENRHEKAQG